MKDSFSFPSCIFYGFFSNSLDLSIFLMNMLPWRWIFAWFLSWNPNWNFDYFWNFWIASIDQKFEYQITLVIFLKKNCFDTFCVLTGFLQFYCLPFPYCSLHKTNELMLIFVTYRIIQCMTLVTSHQIPQIVCEDWNIASLALSPEWPWKKVFFCLKI